MSLKAYDGMMTKNELSYIEKKLKENLPLFELASKKHIAKEFADVFITYFDLGLTPKTKIIFNSTTAEDRFLLAEISENDTTIFNYIYNVAEVLSKSRFVNNFTSHLSLTIETKKNRILVYPNIVVSEHRKILLTFLNDWYAQNQTDKPETISLREWNMRKNDWWDFNEIKGIKTRITLFDPLHYYDNIFNHFVSGELVNMIIEEIPDDETRKNQIHKNNFISLKMDSGDIKSYFSAIDYLTTDEGKKVFDEYKRNNKIELVKIDYNTITNEKLIVKQNEQV
jgi:hypothetical protein